MTRKTKISYSPNQKLEYAKLMVEENYTNKKTQDISGACASAIARWKRQYLAELSGHTPQNANAITVDQQRIQLLEKQLKKAAAFCIRDNPNLN